MIPVKIDVSVRLLCSDGVGRTGTYIMLDIVLNRIYKGAREINIAATLEHIRDQRAKMVKTKVREISMKKSLCETFALLLLSFRINFNLYLSQLSKKLLIY